MFSWNLIYWMIRCCWNEKTCSNTFTFLLIYQAANIPMSGATLPPTCSLSVGCLQWILILLLLGTLTILAKWKISLRKPLFQMSTKLNQYFLLELSSTWHNLFCLRFIYVILSWVEKRKRLCSILVVPAFLTIPNYLSLSLTDNRETTQEGRNITVWLLKVWQSFEISSEHNLSHLAAV